MIPRINLRNMIRIVLVHSIPICELFPIMFGLQIQFWLIVRQLRFSLLCSSDFLKFVLHLPLIIQPRNQLHRPHCKLRKTENQLYVPHRCSFMEHTSISSAISDPIFWLYHGDYFHKLDANIKIYDDLSGQAVAYQLLFYIFFFSYASGYLFSAAYTGPSQYLFLPYGDNTLQSKTLESQSLLLKWIVLKTGCTIVMIRTKIQTGH